VPVLWRERGRVGRGAERQRLTSAGPGINAAVSPEIDHRDDLIGFHARSGVCWVARTRGHRGDPSLSAAGCWIS
jgi:hypothetical protein